jgi:hypothetical protein
MAPSVLEIDFRLQNIHQEAAFRVAYRRSCRVVLSRLAGVRAANWKPVRTARPARAHYRGGYVVFAPYLGPSRFSGRPRRSTRRHGHRLHVQCALQLMIGEWPCRALVP